MNPDDEYERYMAHEDRVRRICIALLVTFIAGLFWFSRPEEVRTEFITDIKAWMVSHTPKK